MINKFYKRINNKYSNFFKFFLFLRYVFTIFFISTCLFLLIPKFFNYEKKQEFVKDYLFKNYHLELNNYSSIEFEIFPLPNLLIKKANLKIKDSTISLETEKINIFLNFKNIYDYENFKARKIILEGNEISLETKKTKRLISYLNQLKYKIDIKALNLNLKKDDNSLIGINNIEFSNYGYKKYHMRGEIFGKKFKALLKNDNKNLKFSILNTGIKANFKFDEKSFKESISGSSKISLLKSFLKFNFILTEKELRIINSNFRNKYLSFSLDTLVNFNPFFKINSNIDINDMDNSLVNKISLYQILENKQIIKKLNGKININYKSKKYFSNLIDSYSTNLNLMYGRLVFSNEILIADGIIECKGQSVLIDEYPRLNFICLFRFKDKNRLFKKFSISSNKYKNRALNIDIEGSFNLLNKKVFFKKITDNNNYLANNEDRQYFKEKFESLLFNDGFFQIFSKNKIKEFIVAIN